jgi:DNA-binding protein WhiA
MAMTAQVKAELASTTVTKTCCRKAEVSAMLRFADALHLVNGGIVVEAELDTGAAARRMRKDIAEVFGHHPHHHHHNPTPNPHPPPPHHHPNKPPHPRPGPSGSGPQI